MNDDGNSQCSDDELNARIHEAGHTLIARYLGFDATWSVVELAFPDPETGRSWEGTTAIRGDISDLGTLIGLAGPIAEMLGGHGPYDVALTDNMVVGLLQSGGYVLSRSDRLMVGECTRDDVINCCALVRQLLPQILADARYDPCLPGDAINSRDPHR